MRINKINKLIGILAALAILLTGAQVFAGVGIEPPENAVILDVEIWGVVTLICKSGCEPGNNTTYAIARVKRVQDCNVETETEAIPNYYSCCPNPATYMDEIKDWSLTGTQFFDIDPTAIPYIDNVKNFEQITDANGDTVTTFDAKFKFYK